jgi:hypothetical protein
MGSIRRFDLNRIIREYKTHYFFETGTFMGEGVEYALQSPFKKIASVEIIPEIADKAKRRFSTSEKVEIVENNSANALAIKMPDIKTNCVFWLDAHFPGADAGIKGYDDNINDTLRLPLINEIEIIHRLRKNFQDVMIIDDLRIYEDGPYENGNVPGDALPVTDRNIDFIYKYFSASHVILKCYLDEGYILVFPKFKYWKRMLINKLFMKKRVKENFYLV